MPKQQSIYNFVLLLFFFFRVGGISCHFCDSKQGHCSTNSSLETRESKCAQGYDYCATYKILYDNQTTAQVTRGCERECTKPFSKWSAGEKYYCKLCCGKDFCNDQTIDPCNKIDSLSAKSSITFVFAGLGLYTNYHMFYGWRYYKQSQISLKSFCRITKHMEV